MVQGGQPSRNTTMLSTNGVGGWPGAGDDVRGGPGRNTGRNERLARRRRIRSLLVAPSRACRFPGQLLLALKALSVRSSVPAGLRAVWASHQVQVARRRSTD